MNKINENTLAEQTYQLLKMVIPMLNRFPRSQRFTLGDRIQNHLSELLELYYQAYYTTKAEKPHLLNKANTLLDILRMYIRLASELNLISSPQRNDCAKRLHEIGKMTGGWLKSIQKK